MTDAEIDAMCREWELPRLNDSAGIDPRWIQSFLAMRIADLLAQVAVGDRLHHLGPDDRAWFRHESENLVADAVLRYEILSLEAVAKDEIEHGHS